MKERKSWVLGPPFQTPDSIAVVVVETVHIVQPEQKLVSAVELKNNPKGKNLVPVEDSDFHVWTVSSEEIDSSWDEVSIGNVDGSKENIDEWKERPSIESIEKTEMRGRKGREERD